jgi:hypothetical protein
MLNLRSQHGEPLLERAEIVVQLLKLGADRTKARDEVFWRERDRNGNVLRFRCRRVSAVRTISHRVRNGALSVQAAISKFRIG